VTFCGEKTLSGKLHLTANLPKENAGTVLTTYQDMQVTVERDLLHCRESYRKTYQEHG
jgi:hypothetical protein